METSPDNTPASWTTRTTITTFTNAWQVSTTDLSALSNVYVRISCTAANTTQPRYIDDIGWTTSAVTSPTLNTIIPGIDVVATTSCAQTITCGTTYTFSDEGGLSDGYVNSKTNTITFTPSVGTNKVQMVFSAFDTENGVDGMVIYNGPSTASPIFPPGLGVGTNATNCMQKVR